MNGSAPDSEVSGYQDVKVFLTPKREAPRFGSVSIRIQKSQSLSTLETISRATALKLRDQLDELLTGDRPARPGEPYVVATTQVEHEH